jgi:myo-inositol-1(or 4)-monophosphatase
MFTDQQKQLVRVFAINSGRRALKLQQSTQFQFKEDGVDLVTEIDKEIEKDFFALSTKHFPGFGFLGEEFAELVSKKEYTWLIDPIDGTKYYANNIPLWCVSIALQHKNEIVYALIYYPAMDQLFEAELGQGASLNGEKLVVKDIESSKSQMSWDCSYINNDNIKLRPEILKEIEEYFSKYYRVRHYGVSALSCVWVATNFLGTFVNYLFSEKEVVDCSAGILIAKEAGCKVVQESRDNYQKITVTRCFSQH